MIVPGHSPVQMATGLARRSSEKPSDAKRPRVACFLGRAVVETAGCAWILQRWSNRQDTASVAWPEPRPRGRVENPILALAPGLTPAASDAILVVSSVDSLSGPHLHSTETRQNCLLKTTLAIALYVDLSVGLDVHAGPIAKFRVRMCPLEKGTVSAFERPQGDTVSSGDQRTAMASHLAVDGRGIRVVLGVCRYHQTGERRTGVIVSVTAPATHIRSAAMKKDSLHPIAAMRRLVTVPPSTLPQIFAEYNKA